MQALAEKASRDLLEFYSTLGIPDLVAYATGEWFDTWSLLMNPFAIYQRCVVIQPYPNPFQDLWEGPSNSPCDPSNVCFQVLPRTIERFRP
jgi:hypothetical protein